MKLSTPNQKNSKKIVIVLSLFTVFVLLFAAYLFFDNKSNQNQQSSSEESSESDIKINPPKPDPEPTPQVEPSYSVDITNVSQQDGYISVESVIDSDRKGTCNFSFTSSGARPITKTSESTGSDGPQLCNVQVPEVEFEKIGQWTTQVRFSTDNSTSEATRNVEIR